MDGLVRKAPVSQSMSVVLHVSLSRVRIEEQVFPAPYGIYSLHLIAPFPDHPCGYNRVPLQLADEQEYVNCGIELPVLLPIKLTRMSLRDSGTGGPSLDYPLCGTVK